MKFYVKLHHAFDIKCKKITLGYCKTIYSPTIISEKLTNLEKFRNSFGGDNYLNYYLIRYTYNIITIKKICV